MRHTHFAIGVILSLIGSLVHAYEIEEEAVFPGSGDAVVSILSTTDTEAFAPLIAAFQKANPVVTVRYTVANSQEVFAAVEEGAAFDLVISSAMDLQLKLANDGFAAPHLSDGVAALPGWARWRDQLFALAQEPVVTIVSQKDFAGLELPRTRADLVQLLRDNPDQFRGRIGTYDPALSGAGYLFATQDTRQSDASWRLAEVMGSLDPKLFTASGAMIDAVRTGELALAYNVLGSYAAARLDGDGLVIEPQDFTHVLLRTALIPRSAGSPEAGGDFLDFLVSDAGQTLLDQESGLPRISEAALAAGPHLRPIRLDPGLLVFVDPLMRRQFLNEWTAAVVQP